MTMRDSTAPDSASASTSSSVPASSVPGSRSTTPSVTGASSGRTGNESAMGSGDARENVGEALTPGPSAATREQMNAEGGGVVRIDRDPENPSPALRHALAQEEVMRQNREAQQGTTSTSK